MMLKNKSKVMGFCLATLLSGCGGGNGGGSGDVTGLTLPDQVALVTPKDNSSASVSALKALASTTSSLASDSDYKTDPVRSFMFDESMEGLKLPNEILCYIDQLQASDDTLLNGDPYLALVNETLCQKGQDSGGDPNNQSTGQQLKFSKWYVESSRDTDKDPQLIKAWFENTPEKEDDFDEVRMKINVDEGKSDANPFGVFDMNFVGYFNDNPLMKGSLNSETTDQGQAHVQLKLGADAMGFGQQVNAYLNADGKSGKAYSKKNETWTDRGQKHNVTKETRVAFNDQYYLTELDTDNGTVSECHDRSDISTNVFQYNLYDTDGKRFDRNGGFGIKLTDGSYGWASYWGVWSQKDLKTGDQVTRSDSVGGEYTVFSGPGRLVKHVKNDSTLGAFKGDHLNYWSMTGNSEVVWDGSSLKKVAEVVCGNNGCQSTPITAETVEITAGQHLGFWKNGLGNIDLVVPENGVLANATPLSYHTNDTVQLDDSLLKNGDIEFKCYSNCIKTDLSESALNSGNVFEDSSNDPSTPYLYDFSADTMTLSRNGQNIVIPDTMEISESSPNHWGVGSGAMILASESIDNVWEIYQADSYYTWETGPNAWNRYVTLIDSDNKVVSFDPPATCQYNDDTHGLFMLNYMGAGQLQGIPFVENADDKTGFSRWIPQFSIADGTELVCDGKTYLVKGISKEQTMNTTSKSHCADLSTDGIGAPDLTFTDPELKSAPTVDSAPAVIGGVMQ